MSAYVNHECQQGYIDVIVCQHHTFIYTFYQVSPNQVSNNIFDNIPNKTCGSCSFFLSGCIITAFFLSGDATFIFIPSTPRNSSEANRQIFAMTSGFLAELPMEAGGLNKVKPLKFQGEKMTNAMGFLQAVDLK